MSESDGVNLQTKYPIDWPIDDVAKGIAMKYDLIVSKFCGVVDG